MAQHDALGVAGRPRGVADRHGVVRPDTGLDGGQGLGHRLPLERFPGGQRIATLGDESVEEKEIDADGTAGVRDQLAKARRVRREAHEQRLDVGEGQRLDHFPKIIFRDENGLRLRMVEPKDDLVIRELGRKRHRGAAGLKKPEFAQHPRASSLGQNGDVIALSQAAQQQGRRESAGDLVRLGETRQGIGVGKFFPKVWLGPVSASPFMK